MKTKILILISVLSISGCALLKTNNNSAIDYNDQVLSHYTALDNQIADFENAIWDSTYTVSDLEKEYNKVFQVYNNNVYDLKSIKPLKKDKWFHAAVVEFYVGVKDALDNEYKQIMDYYNADIREDVYSDKIIELDDIALDKLMELEDNVVNSQQKFADEYGLILY